MDNFVCITNSLWIVFEHIYMQWNVDLAWKNIKYLTSKTQSLALDILEQSIKQHGDPRSLGRIISSVYVL